MTSISIYTSIVFYINTSRCTRPTDFSFTQTLIFAKNGCSPATPLRVTQHL